MVGPPPSYGSAATQQQRFYVGAAGRSEGGLMALPFVCHETQTITYEYGQKIDRSKYGSPAALCSPVPQREGVLTHRCHCLLGILCTLVALAFIWTWIMMQLITIHN